MGAETSILDDCDLDEAIENSSLCPWVIRHGHLDDETVTTTITIFSDQNSDRNKRELFKTNIKNLKSLRHPNILKFLASGEKSGHSYVVTERVVPLGQVLESLIATEICAGLFSVLEGLIFLHDKAGISHNNVCMESVFVTDTGQWKLGGLEHACKFSQVTADYLQNIKKNRNEKSIAPEEKSGSLEASSDFAYSRDVYSFGVLAESLMEYMDDLGDMTKTFELRISDECLNRDPKSRPKLETLLNDRLFRNDFLSISRFLQSITLKSEEEKAEFFEEVLDQLLQIPEETVGKCLTRLLLCRFVLLDKAAQQSLVPHILVPCRDSKRPSCKSMTGEVTPLFRTPVYIAYVIPELHKIFHCHDYHIRMVLLTYFSQYVDLFDKETLEHVILPQVLIGIRDNSDDLAALSLHCLADLVPLLGRDIVIGGRSKIYFSKGMPKFNRQTMKQSNGQAMFHNVNSAMEKVPVLLKDLAKLSSKNRDGENNADEKKKENEQRLQEIRLKREQRKQERLLKASTPNQPTEKSPSPDHSTTKHVHFADEIEDNSIVGKSVISIPDDRINSEMFVKDNAGSEEEEEIVKDEEIFADDKDDWSDWEDDSVASPKDFNSEEIVNKSTESDKPVLQNHVVSLAEKTEYLHSSPSHHYGSTDHWTSSWSSQDDGLQCEDRVMHQDSSSKTSVIESSVKNAPKNKNSKALSLISKTKNNKSEQKHQPLGSEFDIKSLELTVSKEVQEEFDFFADMKPDIKLPKTSVQENVNVSGSREVTFGEANGTKSSSNTATLVSSTTPAVSLSYVVTETEGEADGWGDDLNWDDSGF